MNSFIRLFVGLIVAVLGVVLIPMAVVSQQGQEVSLVCDNVDDTAAWQNAFDTLAEQHGGVIQLNSPCRIPRPVQKNFHAVATSITIRGRGSATAVTLATGGEADAITIQSIDQVLFDNVVFQGTRNQVSDVRNGINLQGVLSASFRHCQLLGLNTHNGFQNGIIFVDGASGWTDLTLDDFESRGTFGDSGKKTAVVTLNNYRNLTVNNVKFLDYTVDGYSKSLSASYAWIAAFNPRIDSPRGDALSKSGIYINNGVFDEGAVYGIVSNPESGFQTRMISVTNSNFNVGGSPAILALHAKNFVTDNLWFGWRQDVPAVPAIQLINVEYPTVERSDYAPGITANILDVDSGAKFLNVINSNLIRHSRAQVTCVTEGAERTCSNATPEHKFIQLAFLGALGRAPNSTEQATWEEGLPAQAGSLANGLFTSSEYAARNRTNAQFVDDLYLTFLGRESDPGGRVFWLLQLEIASRDLIRQSFTESAEFQARVAGLH